MKEYQKEVEAKYGNTVSYQEYQEKTNKYSKEKWDNVINGLNEILEEFALKKKSGFSFDSKEVLVLVEKLQNYITENYYLCTNEILLGLGKMYVEDIRFKNNIDKFGEGTAVFVSSAIQVFCS